MQHLLPSGLSTQARCVNSKLSILIIDSDAAFAGSLVKALRSVDILCEVVDSAEQGRRHAKALPRDLILIAAQLRDMDGLNLLRLLRDEGVETPVVVLAALPSVAAAVVAMRLGALDYCPKPGAAATVIAMIKRVAPACGVGHQHRLAIDSTPDIAPMITTENDPHLLASLKSISSIFESMQDEYSVSSIVRDRSETITKVMWVMSSRVLTVPAFITLGQLFRSLHATVDPVAIRRIAARGTRQVSLAIEWRSRLDTDALVIVRAFEILGTTCREYREAAFASALGISRRHVVRVFKQTGYTFRSWQAGQPLVYAVQALLSTNEQVAQIAYRHGFHHASQFNRTFRSIFGENPTYLRRQYASSPEGG